MRSEPLDVSADLSVVPDDLTAGSDDGQRGGPNPAPKTSAAAAGQADQANRVDRVDRADQAEWTLAAAADAPQRAGRVARFFAEIPLALVIAGVGTGLAVIAMHHFRWGSLAISASVLAGGVFRLVLPTRKAGLLVVRSRFTDVVIMGFLGGALMVLAAVTST